MIARIVVMVVIVWIVVATPVPIVVEGVVAYRPVPIVPRVVGIAPCRVVEGIDMVAPAICPWRGV